MTKLKIKNQSIFWIAVFSLLVQVWGRGCATSSCDDALELTTDETTTTTTEPPKTCSSATEFPKSCSDFQNGSGSNSSQFQSCSIYPNGPSGNSLEVLCDFQVDGGGWTVIQRRSGVPRDDFNRTWNEYKNGFGSLNTSFWLGLENIYALTKNGDQELRIQLGDFSGNTRYAKYSSFSISDASDFYRLTIRGYSGTSGDSMLDSSGGGGGVHNGMRFSTKDKDNDLDHGIGGHCGKGSSSGWWFNNCFRANLNGIYLTAGDSFYIGDGIIWYSWKGNDSPLKTAEMKIRKRTAL